MKKLLSLLLAAVMAAALMLPAFAAGPFDGSAYATVLTGSDFQDLGTAAYDRFGGLVAKMKSAGMPTPDSVLVGGDYTKMLFDYAVPGVAQIRDQLAAVYPDADTERVVCIQGNHDNPSSAFTKTGFYDMGVYMLYVINEDDFPWMQGLRPGEELLVKKLAANIEGSLNAMIGSGDRRPVIVMTHLPLHHTDRMLYTDNKYASYIFNVLNAAGKTLDIVFLFGHQHSGDYDDYIGGSVNFLRPGDTLRVPKTAFGDNGYTEETLTFTYTNCGYIGYSDNTVSDTSTNILTLGAVCFAENSIRFVKFGEDGVYRTDTVTRKNPGRAASAGQQTEKFSEKLWQTEAKIFRWFFELYRKLLALFAR